MPSFRGRHIVYGVALVGIGAVALLLNLGLTPLHFEEPRRAIVALEMELSGNWWVPTINGHFYYNKPPIYNWFLIVLYKLFGYEEWVIRLPSVMSLLLLGAGHFYFFRKRLGAEVAFLSALFWVTSADLLFYFSFQGEIDLFYTLIVYVQVLTIFYSFERKHYWALFLLSYLLCGIGFLTKGLPSLAFQALTLVALFTYKKQFWKLVSLQHVAGIVLLFGVIGGFFWQYSQFNDPVPYLLRLLTESTRRTAVGENSWWETVAHLFTFPAMPAKLLLPWLLFLPAAWYGWKNMVSHVPPWIQYAALFLIANLPLYWLSAGTRERYLYMFLPFFFLILAYWLTIAQKENRATNIALILTLVLTSAGFALPFVGSLQIVDHLYMVAGFFIAFGGFMAYLIYTKRGHPLMLFAIMFLGTRIVFNLTVLPVRANKAKEENYKGQVIQMLSLTGNDPVDLKVASSYSTYPIPFTGDSITYHEIDWPPYQVSYYLSRANRSILQQGGTEAPWLLTEIEAEEAASVPDSLVLTLPSKGRYFQLNKR